MPPAGLDYRAEGQVEVRYIATVLVVGSALTGCGSSSSPSTGGTAAGGSPTTASASPTVASGSTTTNSTTVTTNKTLPKARPKPHPPQHQCIAAGNYKGLYSTGSAFRSDHTMAAPSVPTDGIDWNTILSTEHGCVTAYAVDEFTSPPLGAADIMFLTDGIYLPDDRMTCSTSTTARSTRARPSPKRAATSTRWSREPPRRATTLPRTPRSTYQTKERARPDPRCVLTGIGDPGRDPQHAARTSRDERGLVVVSSHVQEARYRRSS
jgi:hypothetical protein